MKLYDLVSLRYEENSINTIVKIQLDIPSKKFSQLI